MQDKLSIIREMNRMKGLTKMKAMCIQRNREIKGHAMGENVFLPGYKREVPADLAFRINEFSRPVRLAARSCHWREVKGQAPESKVPARPKATSVANLVDGWWQNPGQ